MDPWFYEKLIIIFLQLYWPNTYYLSPCYPFQVPNQYIFVIMSMLQCIITRKIFVKILLKSSKTLNLYVYLIRENLWTWKLKAIIFFHVTKFKIDLKWKLIFGGLAFLPYSKPFMYDDSSFLITFWQFFNVSMFVYHLSLELTIN